MIGGVSAEDEVSSQQPMIEHSLTGFVLDILYSIVMAKEMDEQLPDFFGGAVVSG